MKGEEASTQTASVTEEMPISDPASPYDPETQRYRRLGRASLVYLAGAFLTKAAKFILIPFYVRYLTMAEVGIVVFLEAMSIALARFFPLGLGQAVKRFYVDFEDEREADRYAAGIWWIVLALTVVGGGLAMATVPLWGEVVSRQVPLYLITLAVAGAALQGNFTLPSERYIVRQEPGRHSAYTLTQFVLSTGFIVYLVAIRGMGVEGVLWGQVAAYALWTVVTGFIVNKPVGFQPRFVRIPESFRYAILVVPHLLFSWGITFADRLILEAYVPLDRLGVYGVGYQMGTFLTIFSLSMANAWLARFFRAGEGHGGPEEYSRTLSRMVLGLLWLALAVFVFAPEIIAVVATPAYSEAATILRLVGLGLIFHGLNQAFMLPLFLSKAASRVSLSTGLGLAANIGMNLVLVPQYGIYGAAHATIGAYVVAALSSYAWARRHYPIRVEWYRVSVAAGVAVALGVVAILWLPGGSWLTWGAKTLLLLLFPALLLRWPGGGVIAPADLQVVYRAARSLYRRIS